MVHKLSYPKYPNIICLDLRQKKTLFTFSVKIIKIFMLWVKKSFGIYPSYNNICKHNMSILETLSLFMIEISLKVQNMKFRFS